MAKDCTKMGTKRMATPSGGILDQAQHVLNVGAPPAAVTGIMAFFDKIPWPEIAAFLSCVWLAMQIGLTIYKAFKK